MPEIPTHRGFLRRRARGLIVGATVVGLLVPNMRASSALLRMDPAPVVRAVAAITGTRTDNRRTRREGSAGAPPSAGISAIQIAGQPVLVFDHVVDKTAPNHLPDIPSTAWKEADGTVDVTVPHFENHRMRGPDLESVTSDPNSIFNSTTSASDVVESHYNYHHWLSSPYTFDGRTIYALAHTEWYACELVGDCGFSTPTQYSTGNDWFNSWANTVTSMVSADGGASWAMNGLNEAHVVSNESLTWTGTAALAQRIYHVALNHSGMMSPSRLVKEGAYYYTIGLINHRNFANLDPVTHVAPIDKYDWVLMRTTDPKQAAGWEGWVSGSTYVPLSTHNFSAFSPTSGGAAMNAGEPQIIFDTNAQLYIAIFVVWGNSGAVYYTTTPSLAQPVWSDAVAIGGSATLQTNPRNPVSCSVGFVVNDYVSIIDRHSDGYNFELTDGDPSLFYVYNPANTCGGDNSARDLYRVKLNIVYSTVARPSFASQPASSHVTAGQASTFAVTAGGAASYQWQVSTDHGISWSNVADGAVYTGSTTTTLSMAHATGALDQTQYRCIATNAGINAISNAATLTVTSPPPSDLSVDTPAAGVVSMPFLIGGWALNRSAATGTGVDAVHVYAFPSGGGAPVFVGAASYGQARPDVGGVYGAQFTNSGWNVVASGLAPGAYTLAAYAHDALIGTFDAVQTRAITVSPPVSAPGGSIDIPVGTVRSPFLVSGWAIDRGAPSATGIDAVHVYAYPNGGGGPTFLGLATYGSARSDVGGIFGARFTNSGYALSVSGLAPGNYTLAVFIHSTVSGAFTPLTRTFTVRPPGTPLLSIDTPALGGSLTQPFVIAGWAVDVDAASGTGVDAVHVWAYPSGGGTPIFCGVATFGFARPDVGGVFGAQFTNSGYSLTVVPPTLAPGSYTLVAFLHSTVTGAFVPASSVTISIH